MNEMASTNVRFYHHSGKAPLLGLIIMGIIGFVTIPILAAIYALLVRYIPFIYINALVVIGYAYVLSFVLSWAAKKGKIRNMVILGLAAFFFGVLADYIGWVVWLATLAGNPMFLLEFFFPIDILQFITVIAEKGAWTLRGMTPTGMALYLVWFIEACIVIGGTTYLTVVSLASTPFCEDSDVWADKKSALGIFYPVKNISQFKNLVIQGSFTPFNELKPLSSFSDNYTLLEVYECEQCKSFFVLNVNDVVIKTDNKGRKSNVTKSIVSNLIITPTTLASLKKLNEPKVEALPA